MTKDEIAALPRVELVFMHRFLRGSSKTQWVWGEKDDGEESGYRER